MQRRICRYTCITHAIRHVNNLKTCITKDHRDAYSFTRSYDIQKVLKHAFKNKTCKARVFCLKICSILIDLLLFPWPSLFPVKFWAVMRKVRYLFKEKSQSHNIYHIILTNILIYVNLNKALNSAIVSSRLWLWLWRRKIESTLNAKQKRNMMVMVMMMMMIMSVFEKNLI